MRVRVVRIRVRVVRVRVRVRLRVRVRARVRVTHAHLDAHPVGSGAVVHLLHPRRALIEQIDNISEVTK